MILNRLVIMLTLFGVMGMSIFTSLAQSIEKPNVILIITDDQGYGDLGYHGNPHIKTPVIDKLADESVRFEEFLVSPVCAPTRSSLMTGRYSMRTGVHDTYRGGAIMATSEITIAEVLKNAGYQTGMIGKWHLGDNYPFRPQDQGFDFTLRHLSGGIGQPGDWPNTLKGDSSYFNPILWENGQMLKTKGYCTDVFTDAAIDFVKTQKDNPFFLYLSYNAPHAPLQVPGEYYDMYKNIDPSKGFENDSTPFSNMKEKDKEHARKVYAMVSNIDDNLGRLLNKLKELQLDNNTLVIFLTDNGPQQYRYLAGMRGKKGKVYQGGIRVPSFWRCPSVFSGNRNITTPAAHYDILPTLAELCGGEIPQDRKIEGQSLLSLLKNEKTDMPDRSFCSYWRRGYPKKYHNVSIQKGDYKLVGNCDESNEIEQFELFSIKNDPFEQNNIVAENKQKASSLKEGLDKWLDEMMASPNIVNSPRAIIGSEYENPSFLNLNDAVFSKNKKYNDLVINEFALWEVDFSETGTYEIIIHFRNEIKAGGLINLKTGDVEKEVKFKKSYDKSVNMGEMQVSAGENEIVPLVFVNENNMKKYVKPFYIEVIKRN